MTFSQRRDFRCLCPRWVMGIGGGNRRELLIRKLSLHRRLGAYLASQGKNQQGQPGAYLGIAGSPSGLRVTPTAGPRHTADWVCGDHLWGQVLPGHQGISCAWEPSPPPAGTSQGRDMEILNLHLTEAQLSDPHPFRLFKEDAANMVFDLVPSGGYKNLANTGDNSLQTHFQSQRKATRSHD